MRTEFSIDFPRAYPALNLSGVFRQVPEDFVVNEILGFEPAGEGEHVLVHLEKIEQNTHWVAQQLAEQMSLDNKAIGYCGRKDRHAITRQWFSLYDPKRVVDTDKIHIEGVTLLTVTRHSHKLRPGDHASNQFSIRLRNLRHSQTNQSIDSDTLHRCLADIKQRLHRGVPNYFGEQRFGRDLSNLHAAEQWLVGKQPLPRSRKSMVMSAARAYLFNQVLAKRVRDNHWQQVLSGECLLDGQPTAPLWGRGRLSSQDDVLALETQALSPWLDWCNGLEHCGLSQERRSLQLLPKSPAVKQEASNLLLEFELSAGCFATAVLSEIATLRTAG